MKGLREINAHEAAARDSASRQEVPSFERAVRLRDIRGRLEHMGNPGYYPPGRIRAMYLRDVDYLLAETRGETDGGSR